MKTLIFLFFIFQKILSPSLMNKTRDDFISMTDMIPTYFKESKKSWNHSLRMEIYKGKEFIGYKYYQELDGKYWYVGSYISHTKKYYWIAIPLPQKIWK